MDIVWFIRDQLARRKFGSVLGSSELVSLVEEMSWARFGISVGESSSIFLILSG